MDRFLYIAANGNSNALLAQTVTANNLANINTTGFRADFLRLQSEPVYGPGFQSRVYGSPQDTAGTDFTPGSLMQTGRDLDVAVDGKGWIAVQAQDGTEAYTRAGNLKISPEGLLLTGAGSPVLGNNGPIAIPPAQKVSIGADGTVSIVPLGQEATTLAVVDRIKLAAPAEDQLHKNAQGLLQLPNGETAPADASIQLRTGTLESSNVDAINALVSMINVARGFELQTKLMKTAEDNDAAAAQMMRLA